MHVRITGDTNQESGIGPIIGAISGPTRQQFLPRSYGEGLLGIGVVLMCRDAGLKFKRRVRFAKKTKILYLDIMLDSKQMQMADPEVRKRVVLDRIAQEVPDLLRKYGFQDFDMVAFTEDLRSWLAIQNEPSTT
jgi:hypothetical protein